MLLTTVAYHIQSGNDDNEDGKLEVVYALEGSVFHLGITMQWSRENLGTIEDASEVDALMAHTDSNDGLYFYLVFAGLFAPYLSSVYRITSVL